MSDIGDIRKQFDANKPAPVPALTAPSPTPQAAPQPALPPSGNTFLDALHRMPQNKVGPAYRQRLQEAAATHAPKPEPVPGLSLGDLMDFSPEEAEAAGFKDAAETIRTVHGRLGGSGATNNTATPFASEWGTQALGRLKTVPLQRSTGAWGMNVGNAEQRLTELYFMKAAREQGLPPPAEMKPEQYQALMAESKDKAHRETVSISGVREQTGNVLAPLDVDKMVKDTVEGHNLPAPVLALIPSLGFMGTTAKMGFGPEAKDNYLYNLMAPFLALTRPGVTVDESGAHPVTQRESKMGWMFRMAPSTAVASWLFDPKLTWDLGGQTGFGGTEHVDKVIRGYQLTDEMPRIAEAYDSVTPWESGPWEKTLAAAIPIGLTMMLEPDAVTVGTGLLAAPLVKGAKELGLGVKVLEHVYKPAIEEWKTAAAAGQSLAQISETAGPKGSVKRWLFDAIAGDTISGIVRNSAEAVGDKGAKLGPLADIDQVAGRNIPKLSSEVDSKLAETQEALKSQGEALSKLTAETNDHVAKETVEAHIAASSAVTDYLNKERALVGAAALHGGQEELKAGDLVINNLTGEVAEFKGFSSRQVARATTKRVEPGATAVVRNVTHLPAPSAIDELPPQVTAKLDPLFRQAEKAIRLSGDTSPEFLTRTFRTGPERSQKLLDQLVERGVLKPNPATDYAGVRTGLQSEVTELERRIAEVRALKAKPAARVEADKALAQLEARLADKKQELASAVESHSGKPYVKLHVVNPTDPTTLDAHLVESAASSKVPVGRLTPLDSAVKSVEDLPTGGLAIDSLTGEVVHVDGFHAVSDVVHGVEREAEKGTEAVLQTATGEARVPFSKVDRLGNPERWPDVQAVMTALQSTKKQLAKLMPALKLARDAGDAKKTAELLARLGTLKAAAVKNMGDLSFGTLATAYRESREKMVEATSKLARLKATGKYANPAIAKGMKAMDKLTKDISKLQGAESAALRQKGALDGAHKTFGETLELYAGALGKNLEAIRLGKTGETAFRRGVIDEMVQPGKVLDGSAYYQGLISKYGPGAVDRALASAEGRPFRKMLEGSHRLDVNGITAVREFEKSVHSAADLARREGFEPTAQVLRTLAESKIPFSFTADYAMARGYQIAQKFARATDWVGGTAIGLAPRPVREVVRRGFERFSMIENDLGVVGKAHGVDGIREYLTSTKPFDGAFANRDVMSPADKALAYLRSISKGELWASDPVVQALKNAPLPSGFAADVTAMEAGGALRRVVNKEDTTGAGLVNFIEHSLTGLYGAHIGKADKPDVIFRFVARAVGYGASQHDTVYDLLRATGGGIGEDAAKALNWFAIPEHGTLEAFDAAARREGSAAYGTAKLSTQRGALAHLFKSEDASTKMMKLAELGDGQGIWIPKALQEAMNQVPRDLAKELKEFSTTGTYLGNRLDRLSRLWRVTVANGYFVPRAAYFVNNYVSDIFQVGTTYGFRAGMRSAIQSAPSYIPFVGPRLQDRLFKAAEHSSILSALFDPTVKRVMGASERDIVPFSDGAVSARRAMQEAREDGCFDSMSTRDLIEITRRSQPRWDPLGIPHHIELSARFMETIQSRNRLGVYLRSRMEGMTRLEARDKLVEALYDWKTGVPAWEHATVGRLAVFWSYRRNMLRQLGAALTEGFSDQSVQYGWKALAGNTKLGRTMKVGRGFNSLPDMLYWKDPNEQMDDAEQLHELGMRVAPWWVTSQPFLGNREISKQRKLWTGFDGRAVTFETLMLPTVTTMDQLYLMNLMAQTGAASVVHLSEKAGLSPNLTTVTADEIYEKNINYFTDMLAPGISEFMANALKANLTTEGTEVSAKGIPIPMAQALFLKRLGWEDFLAASPDPNGQVRVDNNAYGFLTALMLSLPPANDLTKNWMIFADNPGYQESLQTGLMEAMQDWTGLARPQAHNPFQSMDFASMEMERRLKAEGSTSKKQVFTREQLHR